MHVLALNSGSSSLKFLLCDGAMGPVNSSPHSLRVMLRGAVERIGGAATLMVATDEGRDPIYEREVADHSQAVEWLFERLGAAPVDAVGHRIVHGGSRFLEPVVVDHTVVETISMVSDLAPLHNRAALAVIRTARRLANPQAQTVAVFDTAFHHTIPEEAAVYALPQDWTDRYGIRRFGFHGLAHASAAGAYAAAARRSLTGTKLVTLHLGNGCSATAIRDGRSLDTSMGFTPLEGLVMGSRVGDCDVGIVAYLARRTGLNAEEIERHLNERSGLLGLSGCSTDMRDILAAAARHDARAELAVKVFCHRARKYLGAYLALLGGATAVVFSGGIGERSPAIRSRICADMEWCGLRLDKARNEATTHLPPGTAVSISEESATLACYVAAVDEEDRIARETLRCLTPRNELLHE